MLFHEVFSQLAVVREEKELVTIRKVQRAEGRSVDGVELLIFGDIVGCLIFLRVAGS